MAKSKGPSQRQLRVGEVVRHVLTEVLQREAMPAGPKGGAVGIEAARIAITEVRMSPDLKIATCFVSVLNAGEGDVQRAVKALAANARFLRGRAAPKLDQMRYMPTFRFMEDTSFENFARIDALLRSDAVRRDLDSAERDERPDTRLED